MKTYKIIAIIAIAILFFVAFMLIINRPNQRLLNIEELEFDVRVNKTRTGFNLDKDKIHFGKMPPGNSAFRDIIMTNNITKIQYVVITGSGEAGSWISAEPNEFFLDIDETITVKIFVNVPIYADEKLYEGKIKIYFYEILR